MPNQNLAAELRQMGTHGFGAMGSGTRGRGSPNGHTGLGAMDLDLACGRPRSRLSVSVASFKGRIILEMAGRRDRDTELRRQVGQWQ